MLPKVHVCNAVASEQKTVPPKQTRMSTTLRVTTQPCPVTMKLLANEWCKAAVELHQCTSEKRLLAKGIAKPIKSQEG